MQQALRSRRRAGFALVATAIFAVAVAGVFSSRVVVQSSAGFWEQLRIEGREVKTYDSLRMMLDDSDAVVMATVTDVEIGRTVQGDSPDDVVTYAQLNLRIDRVLSGKSPAIVPLEFLVGATPKLAEAEVESLRKFVPTEASVFFLHEKQGEHERGLYRLTSSTGLWSTTARADVDAPLQDESPSGSGLYADEIGGVKTIAELADLLTDIARTR